MVCSKEPSTGEIIGTSANQIVLPKFRRTYKNFVLYSPDPLSSCSVEGESGAETSVLLILIISFVVEAVDVTM